MATTTPHTWTASEIATSTNLQTLTQAILDVQSPKRCHAYQNVGQVVATAATTAVTLDSEEVDTDAMHSTVTNTSRITCVTAGRYRFIGQVAYPSNATGYRSALLRKNGSNIAISQAQAANGASHYQQVVDEILLAVGDYVELFATQSSGGNLTLIASASSTFLHAAWVSTS